jgi:hypothetical protein
MNLKNVTTITAIAALLSTNTSAFAVWEGKSLNPLNLYVQNNTEYDLTISQRNSRIVGIIKAHEANKFTQLPFDPEVSNETELFFDAPSFFGPSLFLMYDKANMITIHSLTRNSTEIAKTINLAKNKLNVNFIINGSQANDFDKSNIFVTVGRKIDTTLNKIVKERLLNRLEKNPKEQSPEQLIQMKR